MANGMRFKRVGLVAVAVAAAAAPGIALAATTPKPGGFVSNAVLLRVSSTRKSMKVQSTGYCHRWTIRKVAINHGTFSFTGSTTSGKHAVLNGSFVTARKATGSVKVGSCAKKSFTAYWTAGY
jgi:hypothetical protein